jgi:hypothetical protein
MARSIMRNTGKDFVSVKIKLNGHIVDIDAPKKGLHTIKHLIVK